MRFLFCFIFLTNLLLGKENFLVILVDAPHLDYSSAKSLLKTIARHPNGCTRGDVGHAWIYLQGNLNGEPVFIEGGHSGELGVHQAKYFDGVMNYVEYGYSNPTKDQIKKPRHEPNPIKYLQEVQYDGFFQNGRGFHTPTMAVKFPLSPDQFHKILDFLDVYDFKKYSMTNHQCVTFAIEVARLANLDLNADVTVKIDPLIKFRGASIHLWKDPRYMFLTFSSPDKLEVALKQTIREGRGENVTSQFLRPISSKK